MFNDKHVNTSCVLLKKKKKYFNYYYLNTYISMFIKRGKSKFFKKKIIKIFNYLFFKKLEKYFKSNRSMSLNYYIEKFVYKKVYNVFFSVIKNNIYVNHRKSCIYNLTFCILNQKKRKNFFLKFTKYFFLKKKWKKNIKNFFFYNLRNQNSLIHNVYKKAFNKIVLKV